MPQSENDIILIDSDSEVSDPESPPSKRHKPYSYNNDNDNNSNKNNTINTKKLSITPFQDDSSSSSEDEHPTLVKKQAQVQQFPSNRLKEHYYHDEIDEEVELLSMQSSRAPPKPVEITNISSDDDDEEGDGEDNEEDDDDDNHSDSSIESSDSDFRQISFSGSASPETIAQTRKYLKTYGNIKFLEKYLPTAASSEDIIKLIIMLGFMPRHLHTSGIMDLINILNRAMIKVKAIRSRLDDVKTVDDAIGLIEKSKKILVITGAGISTSLGIPDFRSSQGFYTMVQHLGLSDPQEVFDLEIFHTDPSLFYSIAYMILPPERICSPLHSFISLLQSKGKLLRNYTQNIDNLESYAGIKPDKLIQCHGSFATATCVTCRLQIPGEKIFPQIRAKQIPYCPQCAKVKRSKLKQDDDYYFSESFGVFKPDITFFGESLPKLFHDRIVEDIMDCDLLISIGTSLKVAPVADIVDKIPEHVPQILINKDPIEHCNFDVSLLGYCDDVASYISNRLGEDWRLPHKDYESIRGYKGSNLEIMLEDEHLREYQIINKAKASSDLESGSGSVLTVENTPLYEDPPSTAEVNTPPPAEVIDNSKEKDNNST
ncbi:uncharacterized protein J8A68_002497 [[Candida] subhashii]|uniref:Deacetylase sirtuin-type domain-containing protein n=1 Tax=[Candida] subhashii TaxID=561895 RepID=A0A8J5QG96_9ASCO|nr:uncharacterized protein J8A68_002497 [[Candida] subhashii]KAG7663996.1 hypothetical protein J8A68_002497 [[Candida] subhashii]